MEEALLLIETRIEELRETVAWGEDYMDGVEERMENKLANRRTAIENIPDQYVRESSGQRLEENWSRYGIDLLHARTMHQSTELVIEGVLTDIEEIAEDENATVLDFAPLATRILNAYSTLNGVTETLQAWELRF
ncbi:unnamed protein product [Microthlaspi erraticum]|uniref:Uncharacterized protein n=1 Tax=Microthlaspi erraticum TaxID=1685480 RepID=A0A6D2JNI1_9BRAS|nr:unnamed protein product [Microthlaspi erraticum]